MTESTILFIEDLEAYGTICELRLKVCTLTSSWPAEERYELGRQIRRSSNSASSQLAEKNDRRHSRNKFEGINRARGETAETIDHLNIAFMKDYIQREMPSAIMADLPSEIAVEYSYSSLNTRT